METGRWFKQFNIWLRRWLAGTCYVAPHNSDLFGQCNYPSQATGERPSDQLAHCLVSCKYPDKVVTANTDQGPDLVMNHGGAVSGTSPGCHDEEQRFLRTRLGWLLELREIESGSRGLLLTPQKLETDRGKNGKHRESLARLKQLLESISSCGKRSFERWEMSCCKISVISHGAASR